MRDAAGAVKGDPGCTARPDVRGALRRLAGDVRPRFAGGPTPREEDLRTGRSPPRWRAVAAVLAGGLLVAPRPVAAQRAAPDASGPLVLELEVRERWLPLARDPRSVPFTDRREVTDIRWRGPARPGGALRWHHFELAQRNVEARLSVEPDGRIFSAEVTPPPLRYTRHRDPDERARWRRRRLRGSGPLLRLPFSRFAEIPFPVPAGPMDVGTTWVDTLAFVSDPGEGMQETLEGVWRHEVVGDTSLDGRTLPLVRTRADVRYRSVDPAEDASIDATLRRTRELAGTLVGSAVVDADRLLRVRAADTARWEGEEVLELPDGRRLRQPARYEGSRSWVLRDSAAWAARRDSLREEGGRRSTGMLILPTDALSERLRRGEPGLVDSLLVAWRRTDDPQERRRLRSAVERWAPRDTADPRALDRRIRALLLEAGDTATAAARLLDRGFREPVTDEELDLLLPLLDDPGVLHRLDLFEEFTYYTPAEVLTRRWPVGGEPAADRPCVPSACARLLALRRTATEPRLRDLGLVLSYLEDPARWHDTLVARSAGGSRVVRPALAMGRGIGATWAAAPGDTVPATGASWRAWLGWMGGEVRFEPSHLRAIRLFELRTGRDVAAELLARWPAPPSPGDSAALVLGTVLQRMGALPDPTPEALAQMFVSGSAADLARARDELGELLARGGEPPTPALAAELLLPLIDSIANGGDSPWPALEGLSGPGDRVLHRDAASSHGVGGVARFLSDENLPADLALPSHVALERVTGEAWASRPRRQGGWILRFDPIRTAGPFVDLSWRWTVYRPRGPDEAPSGYAGGGGLRLLRTEAGWRVVDRSAWIT